MGTTVFYAWQSDRDAAVCRFLIRDAVKLAVKKLNADAAVKSAPPFDLDHDTKGTTGHQHIASVIRKKIKGCGVFVADLTHVASYRTADKRPRRKRAQNPNVLIELGIAIRAKGFGRLILVMNDAFGPPDDLPFDLKSHSFPITYTLKDATDPEAVKKAKEGLADALRAKLKPMLAAIQEESAAKLRAKEDAGRSMVVSCRTAMAGLPSGEILSFLSIEAVNTGVRPVTLTQAGIALTDGRTFIPAQTRLGIWKLPKKLEESDTVTVLAEVDQLHNEMQKAQAEGKTLRMAFAYMTDSSGKVYKSGSLENWTPDNVKPRLT